jgi:hypothetical protein
LIFDSISEVSKTNDWYIDFFEIFMYLGSLWLGTWWVRGELRLTLGKKEVLGSIPVGGD